MAAESCDGNETASHNSPSVAVLPFVTIDDGLTPIATAMARDITVGLARTRWISMVASATTERWRASGAVADGTASLGARYVCDGSLMRVGAGYRLSVSLSEAGPARVIWADILSGDAADPASIMADICTRTIAAIEREVERSEQRRALLSPIRDDRAWLGLHGGMSLLQRQERGALAEAGRALREAARADPTCARIAAARSWYCWQSHFFGVSENRDRTVAEARDHALESIALDPGDPLGYWALGRADWLGHDMDAAADNLSKAVSLNPSFAMGHYALGYTRSLTGDDTSALTHCLRAIWLSPLDPLGFAFHCIVAHVLCFRGETEAARHHARRIAAHPNVHAFGLAVAAWVNELSGDRRAAEGCLARIRERWPGYGRRNYHAALLHQSPHYRVERKRAIDAAFDRLGF